MKIKSRPIVRKQFYLRCVKCSEEITGNSIETATYNFEQHYNKKHKGEKGSVKNQSQSSKLKDKLLGENK